MSQNQALSSLSPISKDRLVAHIRENGLLAREARQVWQRLEKLLPNRLRQLQEGRPIFQRRGGRTRALLEALNQPEYSQHIDEIVETSTTARKARIEYETAMMMIEAQRTLRRLRSQEWAGARHI